jgi:formylglycine-generating enzyme required for sulfatase activity
LYGQADLAGNAWEWVQDYVAVGPYAVPCDNCANLTDSFHDRVLRGGGLTAAPEYLLSSYRLHDGDGYNGNDFGARCARTR